MKPEKPKITCPDCKGAMRTRVVGESEFLFGYCSPCQVVSLTPLSIETERVKLIPKPTEIVVDMWPDGSMAVGSRDGRVA